MFISVFRFIVVITVMCALVGQTVANASMACVMMQHDSSSHDMPMSHASTDHHSMEHPSMGSIQMDVENGCCDIECQCPESACTSMAFLSSSLSHHRVKKLSEKINLALFNRFQVECGVRYRPPIIA